jgi:Ca-activated chloride channel family protein
MSPRALAVLCLAAIAAAQVTIPQRKKPAPKEAPKPSANIRVDTSLILVPCTVNDPINRPVSGLEKENFRVFDDGVEQQIAQFAMDDQPVAVGLVFDTSGSMGDKLRMSRMAAHTFFHISNPEDEFFLVEFDDAPHLRVRLTHDVGDIEDKLTFSKSHGSTALLDAIFLALHEMKNTKLTKKALLLITDGGDNHSRYSVKEVQSVVRESDTLIYSIGVFGGGASPEETDGPWLLRKISEQTGGRLFVAGAAELPDIAQKIGIELHNRYILAFTPQNLQRDGKLHRITVKVVPPRGLPKLHATWRTGYNAPIE